MLSPSTPQSIINAQSLAIPYPTRTPPVALPMQLRTAPVPTPLQFRIVIVFKPTTSITAAYLQYGRCIRVCHFLHYVKQHPDTDRSTSGVRQECVRSASGVRQGCVRSASALYFVSHVLFCPFVSLSLLFSPVIA
jgi:hypothetical protein